MSDMNIYIVNEVIAYEGERTLRVASTLANAMGTATNWEDCLLEDWETPEGTRRVWERTIHDGHMWQHIYEVEVDYTSPGTP